jgi:hypothetical protein
MGTNFYRIPTEAEVNLKINKLKDRIESLDLSPGSIERGFSTLDCENNNYDLHSPWSEFIEDISIHLGKRSMGWKFCWNFHKEKYYSNKDELLAFIRSGRVVDEYGREEQGEEFIQMALDWGKQDGLIFDEKYEMQLLAKNPNAYLHGSKYWDTLIDGLRVSSSTEFS